MGSEKGRGLKVRSVTAALWGRKTCVASATLVCSGELCRSFDDCVVGSVRHHHRMELGNNLRRSGAPRAAHSCSRGSDPGLSSLWRNVLGRAGARKRGKRKLQSEPSLVYIVRNTHGNTPNTHAYHTHTKKLVHFLWQTHNSLA